MMTFWEGCRNMEKLVEDMDIYTFIDWYLECCVEMSSEALTVLNKEMFGE